MKLSVIIPLHNHLALTQAMLASLRATLPARLKHEIILVDNASTDGTRDWLKEIAGGPIHAIFNQANLGYAAANNRAVKQARGEFVALLNNDLVLLPGWLEPMLEIARDPGMGVVGNVHLSVRSHDIFHAGVFFDRAGRPFHFRPPPSAIKNIAVIESPAVTGACVLLRRALFDQLGGFDENYVNGYEDIDLCLRALAQGHHNAVATRSTVYHYIGMSEGRYRQEGANAARFEARWGGFARGLARIEPPAAGRESAANPSGKSPFHRHSFATLQAFHPGPAGHSEPGSSAHLYPTGGWASVRVPLPHGVVRDGLTLRLDPCDFPATLRVAGFEVKDAKSGKPVWTVGPEELAKVFEIAGTAAIDPKVDAPSCRVPQGTRQDGASTFLTVVSTGTDPQLRLRAEAIPAGLARRAHLTAELHLLVEGEGKE